MSDLEKAQEEQEEKHHDALAEHVMDCFRRAKSHRDNHGVSESIIDSLRRYRGKYKDEEICNFEGIDNYRNITGKLVKDAHDWLKDAYFKAQDRPWTLDPSPEPELPQNVQDMLLESLQIQLNDLLISGSGASKLKTEQRRIASELRNTASYMAMEYAKESAEGMTRTIEDQLTEAGWRNVFSEFLLDLCVYPVAILKGPVIRNKEKLQWVIRDGKSKPKWTSESGYYVERVDPIDIFPSPDSTDTQNGEFIIERMKMSRARLNEAKSMKNFSSDAINLAFDIQDENYKKELELYENDSDQEKLDAVGRTDFSLKGSIFDVYEYHGRIKGSDILEWLELEDKLEYALENFDEKVDTDWGTIDPYEDYETVLWVCNNITIMARMTPSNPIPYRPYYKTSCFKIPGSFWGECIPMVLADIQDEINMAVRARTWNAGMSSGPISIVDGSRFTNGQAPTEVMPWDVFVTQTNTLEGNNAARPIQFEIIPNVTVPLTQIIEQGELAAHKYAGIPPYMDGFNQGSAETLGAFSLQYAGATKGIKSIISNVDQDVIEKFITQMYYYNMYYNEDESIKADVAVNVRGASGLIAQEQRQARPLEMLSALGPILAQMKPEAALALANEALTESGYDPKSLGLQQGILNQEAANRQIGVGQPQVDGRSGPVQQQIQNSQIPPNI